MAFCNVFAKFYFLIMAPPSPQRCLVWNLGVSFSKCCSAAKLQRDIGTSPVSTQSSCSHPWVSFGIASYGRCRDKRETVLKPARACIQGCVCVSLSIYMCVCVRARACVYIPPTLQRYSNCWPRTQCHYGRRAELPWQRLERLVARWRDITAGLCNNLS